MKRLLAQVVVLLVMALFVTFGTSYAKRSNAGSEIFNLINEDKIKEALSAAVNIKDRHLIKAIKFLYYSDPDSNASFEEIIRFVQNNPDFPNKKYMINLAEGRINKTTSQNFLKNWCLRSVPSSRKWG